MSEPTGTTDSASPISDDGRADRADRADHADRADRFDARAVRRLAMQLLYQLDSASPPKPTGAAVDREALLDQTDPDHDRAATRESAVDLAIDAWKGHAEADRLIAELTPEWPTHRQPPVDRALLRLGHHEIAVQRVPVRVAINEAVELAKLYAGEHSPAFINAVLDKVAARLGHEVTTREQDRVAGDKTKPIQPETADDWLRDAVRDEAL